MVHFLLNMQMGSIHTQKMLMVIRCTYISPLGIEELGPVFQPEGFLELSWLDILLEGFNDTHTL